MPLEASGGGYDGPLAYRQGKPMRPDVALAFDRLDRAAHRAGGELVITADYDAAPDNQSLALLYSPQMADSDLAGPFMNAYLKGIRVYDGKVFRLKEHVDRLFESARHIKLEIPLSKEQMVEAILGTVKANNKQNGYIRLIVTRGPGTVDRERNAGGIAGMVRRHVRG